MSGNELEEFENDNGPAALRKALKQQKQANKDLLARLEALESAKHGTSVRDALAARGLNPSAARFWPQGQPVTDESVDQWVEENRDVFGFREKANPQNQTSEVPTDVQRGYSALKDLQAAEAYTEMDFKSKLAECESPEAVIELLKGYSPPTG